MDALSDVLQAVRLTGAIFFDVTAAEPWVAETPRGTAVVDAMFPGSKHLICYHVITQGTCWVCVDNAEPTKLSAGDVIVFPHGDPHVLSSLPGMRKSPDMTMYRRPKDGQLPVTILIGNKHADAAKFVCGFLGCDAKPFNPLLAALPRFIHVNERAGGAISSYVQFALAESNQSRIGGEGVLGRLSELMFVDVVRRYLEGLPPEETNWLAGLRDPFVGKALSTLHRRPSRDWTLQSLSKDVGLSRSALAERFMHFVGTPPIQYLTNWRMQLAANRLSIGSDSVAEIASQVGYESEAAFSRVFKKIVGVPPGEWRKRRNAA